MQYSIGRTEQQNISVGGITFNQKEMQAAYLNGKQIYPNEKQIIGLFSVAPDESETIENRQLFQVAIYKPLIWGKPYTFDGLTEHMTLTHRGKKYNLMYHGEDLSIPPDATIQSDRSHVYKSFSTEDFGYVEEGDEIELDFLITPYSGGFLAVPKGTTGTVEIGAPLITSMLTWQIQSLDSNLRPVGNNTIKLVSYPDKTTLLNKSGNSDGANILLNRISSSLGLAATISSYYSTYNTTQMFVTYGAKRSYNTPTKDDALIGKIKGKVIPYTTVTPSQL